MINLNQVKYFALHFILASRKGHGIHSPFAYQLCEEVFYNDHAFYDFVRLGALRLRLLRSDDLPGSTLEIEDHGAGSRTLKGSVRKISDIVAKGTSTQKQSELLYRLCNFLNCKTTIELGTSVGLNTLYLALSNKAGSVYTVEGSGALVDFAINLAEKNKITNIEFIHSKFKDALPALLQKTKPFDLLYIDGDHRYESTVEYFNLAVAHIHNNSVIILDDIYWSPGMTKAWQQVKKHPSVTISIDCFYFGLLFFRQEVKEPVSLRLWI